MEASVAMAKGAERSGRWRTGFDRKRDLRVLKDVWQVGVQFHWRFFLVRLIRGQATLE